MNIKHALFPLMLTLLLPATVQASSGKEDSLNAKQKNYPELQQKKQQLNEKKNQLKAQQQNAGKGKQRNLSQFSEFDRDGNGQISPEELNAARSERIRERSEQGYPMKNLGKMPAFEALDKNKDGHIDADEFSQHQGDMRR